MPRPVEFERAEVLTAAMQVFWTHGYQATSMIDLEQATGLRPGSIYNAFESKKGLFLQVIDHYRTNMVSPRIESILNIGPPMAGIEAFFKTTYEDFEPDQLIGCMLTNTATEVGNDDQDIQQAVTEGILQIEAAFKARLREAQQTGDFDPKRDTGAAALHLTSCYQGLSVIGRLTRNKERLALIASAALDSIRKQ